MIETINQVTDFLNDFEESHETPLHITIGPNGYKSIQLVSQTDFKRIFPIHDVKPHGTLLNKLVVEIEGVEVLCLVGSDLL